MLVAAVLVPDTALLVPGAAGRRDVARELRTSVLAALRAALGDGPARVVVVAPADERAREEGPVELVGAVTASLAAAGVPDAALADVPAVRLAPPSDEAARVPVTRVSRPPSVASAVALHLLAAAGRREGVRVVEVPRPAARVGSDDPRAWTGLGGDLVAGDGPVVLVVVGSGSGRHGPDAPLAEDAAALDLDAMLVTALVAADRAGVAVLAGALTAELAAALAVSGWLPWRVLAGAALGSASAPDDAGLALPPVTSDVTAPVLLGAQHVVGTWRVAA